MSEWIWVSRWEDFQHYRPDPHRAPAWIKSYTKQLDDDEYRSLTPVQRALLHDLRLAFAKAHGKLSTGTRQVRGSTATAPRQHHESITRGTRQLSQRLGYRVTTASLEALRHAGFIEFVSRETLEHRLEKLYSPPRARVEVEKEKEKEKERSLDADASPPVTDVVLNGSSSAGSVIGAVVDLLGAHDIPISERHRGMLGKQAKDLLASGFDVDAVVLACVTALRRGEPQNAHFIAADLVTAKAGQRMTRREYERALEDAMEVGVGRS